MAQEYRVQDMQEAVVENTTHVNLDTPKSITLDLYAVGASLEKEETTYVTVPFVHWINVRGPDGKPIQTWAHFDDGTMKEAMSTTKFQESKDALGTIQPLSMHLHMANRSLVKQWSMQM